MQETGRTLLRSLGRENRAVLAAERPRIDLPRLVAALMVGLLTVALWAGLIVLVIGWE